MAWRLLSVLPRRAKCRYSTNFSNSTGSDGQLFDKLLIANRGEIACRVMRTAKRLGIRTVAVYSEADSKAMHVEMADEAHCIGPPPSSESYLRQDKIMAVARETGAQAIHPGYGFLSENKGFAELCQSQGVEFVGPPPSAIEKMGIKGVSKKIMSESSVPIVPGYFGADQSNHTLKMEAEKLGFPVMIKADLGGGGKGMRIAPSSEEFQQLLDACRSEATKSFGDDKVLIEKFVDRARHVEVQVFGDKLGGVVHLFERDCSVQRRHQKIIEEAPAPGLRPDVREKICLAAVRAAQAVGYVGAGTVEFILDANQDFYFMEMNTRLQVEHPVTEMITGTDLVEWQLRVAAGEPLPLQQSELLSHGHAFEARIYAENPDMNFSPSPGLLRHLRPPQPSDTVRIDTGVRPGDEVTTFYDPMIAKLVVWDRDRSTALKKLHHSLGNYQIAGVSTNVRFLERLSCHPSFQEGDVHTGFIEQHDSELFPPAASLSESAMFEAALCVLALEDRNTAASHTQGNDPFSPFSVGSGVRVNTWLRRGITLKHNDESFRVDVQYDGRGGYTLSQGQSQSEQEGVNAGVGGVKASAILTEEPGKGAVLTGVLDGRKFSANVAVVDETLHIFTKDGSYQVEVPTPDFVQQKGQEEDGGIHSPKYPSTVTKVFVTPGQDVSKGSILMTVEGMKMETNILAVKDGVIKTVFYSDKDNVPAFSKVVEYQEED